MQSKMYIVYGDTLAPTVLELPEAVHHVQAARAAMVKALGASGYVIIAATPERAIVTYQFIKRVVGTSRHTNGD
jgi:hypothetical protein